MVKKIRTKRAITKILRIFDGGIERLFSFAEYPDACIGDEGDSTSLNCLRIELRRNRFCEATSKGIRGEADRKLFGETELSASEK